jgi:hypothetical protein
LRAPVERHNGDDPCSHKRLVQFFSLVAAGLIGVIACSPSTNAPTSPSAAALSSELAQTSRGPTQAPRLVLSHVECVQGQVEVHFVLLFVPDGVTPGASVSFSSPAGTAPRGKNAGNTWHYTANLPSGSTVNITSATVQVGSQTVSLHNPGAYAGTYNCAEVCATAPAAQSLVCLNQPLGNEGSECSFFAPGSAPLGKDDNLSVSSWNSTRLAAVAIVKDGKAGCSPGQTSYRIYPNVNSGQTLLPPSGGESISHVTYCSCPASK